jgi:hypothetical protein
LAPEEATWKITVLPELMVPMQSTNFALLGYLGRRDHILAVNACLGTYIGQSWHYKGRWLIVWLVAHYFPSHGPVGKDQLPTGPAGAPHSVRRSRVSTSLI